MEIAESYIEVCDALPMAGGGYAAANPAGHILTFKMAFFTTSGNEAGRMRRPTIRRLSSQS
ncbi:MAG: hypothetical protein ILA03_03425 [Bacteroidaceae bacterium]|nr:hypothetical protein [Bacteroidaceae bacterium]MBQ9675163.1 hypothetical protein [Bacteroidaceae bacterium]